jgi:DNA-binding transcriptional regulator YhcF (GntR family)
MDQILKAATGARSLRAIATQIGMEPSTLNRQTKDLPVRTLVAICRAYGIPVVPMFVKVGYITAEEAASGMLEQALANATDAELMTETLRRVQAGKASPTITGPVDVSALTHDADDNLDVTNEVRSSYGRAAQRGPRKADQLPSADD